MENPISRRRFKKLGGVAAIAGIAGCFHEDDGPGAPGEDIEDEADEDDMEDPDNDDEEDMEDPDDEPNGDVEQFELEGETQHWIGIAPEEIAGEENPTLEVEEGQEYEIEWENIDGAQHNIAIIDEDEEVVEDYETELVNEEGESQTLEFTATAEMAGYICDPHPDAMAGVIEVVNGEGDDDAVADEED